jgi:hypothetical protein
VARVITADTLQQGDLVADVADWNDCVWVWSTDLTLPVADARIVGHHRTSDGVAVLVEYEVLGRARSGEFGTVFVHDPILDTLRFNVFVTTNGDGRVRCGEYNLNHPSLGVFLRDWVPHLDSASSRQWNAAWASRRGTGRR